MTSFTLDFDEGESLRHLLEAEKNLLQNYFSQVITAHAAGSQLRLGYKRI